MNNTSEKERERKSFKLPVIVPIVLYNGAAVWTAPLSFKKKLAGSDLFDDSEDKILDFTYRLIRVQSYQENELIKNGNLISSVFYLDQVRNRDEIIKRLNNIKAVLQSFSMEDYRLLLVWFKNILADMLSLKGREQEEVTSILEESQPKEVGTMITNIERVLRSSIEEEREKAREEERKKYEQDRKKYEQDRKRFILGALGEGLPLETVARITGLDEEMIIDIKNGNF